MDGAVGDADDVAVGDGVALGVLGILDGGGDLAGLDVGERLGHGLDVILEGCLAVHAEHGGEGLRHGLGGHDACRDVGQLAGGLGGHDDVLVVRKEDDRVGVDLGGGIEQVLRGGVHGLAAGDDHVDAERLQDLGVALAGGDRHEPERLALGVLLGLELLGALLGLQLHVVDEHLGNLAALEEVRQHLVGRVGVNVHLELRRLAHAQLAVAHGCQEVQRLGLVEHVGIHQELVAVGELAALPVVDLLDLDLRSGVARKGQLVDERALLAREGGHEAVDEDGKAVATGVHHAVLLQHGKQLGRALHAGIRLLDDVGQRLIGRHLLLAGILGGGSGVLQHGEDGALDGLAHRVERHVLGLCQGRLDGLGANGVEAVGAFAQTAQDLRGDDAGVAARAHERAGGDGLADLGGGSADGQLGQACNDGFQRQRHVRAGVAIGHGEDVETVDLVFARAEVFAGGRDCVDQVVAGIGTRH